MKKIFLSLLIIISLQSKAQFNYSSELGIMAGPVFFQSDYGERYDLDTNFGNNGFGIGVFHILNFSYSKRDKMANPQNFFNDHFKLRTELSYTKSNFRHYGKWVEDASSSLGRTQLNGMRGSSAITNLGMQFEYYPWGIYDYDLRISKYNLSPFISLGTQYSWYTSKAWSTLGDVNNPAVTFPKYLGASKNESNGTISLVGSVGARYKLDDFSDFVLDLRWQYFNSNWVDGLNPDSNKYPENKSNDMLFWVNVGYIYHFE